MRVVLLYLAIGLAIRCLCDAALTATYHFTFNVVADVVIFYTLDTIEVLRLLYDSRSRHFAQFVVGAFLYICWPIVVAWTVKLILEWFRIRRKKF